MQTLGHPGAATDRTLGPSDVSAALTQPSRSSATLTAMESKVAKAAEQALVEATQRLVPEERLNAFLVHCRLIVELYEAGQKMRASFPQP